MWRISQRPAGKKGREGQRGGSGGNAWYRIREEIERSFSRLRNLGREQAVLGEHERIMRDMHDGMGSRLMAGVHMIEKGEMEASGGCERCFEGVSG